MRAERTALVKNSSSAFGSFTELPRPFARDPIVQHARPRTDPPRDADELTDSGEEVVVVLGDEERVIDRVHRCGS